MDFVFGPSGDLDGEGFDFERPGFIERRDGRGVWFVCAGVCVGADPAGWVADRYGPRVTLAAVVAAWSVFTALTGLAPEFPSLVVIRFLFGLAEAGAFPASARAFYTWLPAELHGRANGIIFGFAAGGGVVVSDPGGAVGRVRVAGCVFRFGGAGVGMGGGMVSVVPGPGGTGGGGGGSAVGEIFQSRGMLQVMGQYFASNFTFFLCLSWMLPYLMERYQRRERASWYSMTILLVGATAQWVSEFRTGCTGGGRGGAGGGRRWAGLCWRRERWGC